MKEEEEEKNSLKPKDSTAIEKILAAAMDVFGAKGLEGARMDEIAAEAGVNKATIYYHLGGKEALYQAILQKVFTAAGDAVQENARDRGGVEEKLKNHVKVLVAHSLGIKNFAPIMMRELASGGEYLSDEVVLQLKKITGAVARIVKEGIEKSVFRKANPFVIHMAIVGSILVFISGEDVRRRVSKGGEAETGFAMITTDKMAEEIADILISGIKI